MTRSREACDRVAENCAKRTIPASFQRNSVSIRVPCYPRDADASLTLSRGMRVLQVARSRQGCERVGRFVLNAHQPYDSSPDFWALDLYADF